MTLAEQLHHPATAKLVLLTCGNLGCSHAANVAVYEALRSGVATSASLMVPCPWSREAAANYRGEDLGVELTLNAPYDTYRWGPLTYAPSLLDGDGGFPRTPQDLWDHADTEEVARECRVQLERAGLWGFDINYLGVSQNALAPRPEFFDICLSLAEEFQLPLRLHGSEKDYGFPFRQLAAERGVLSPDHVVQLPPGSDPGAALAETLAQLPAGVTEILLHPALDTEEQRALDPNWSQAHAEHQLLSHNATTRELLAASDAIPISYRELKQAQRQPG